MADKPATGHPQDDVVTDSKQGEASSETTDSKEEDNVPEKDVALKPEETLPEITRAKPEETSPKVPDCKPVANPVVVVSKEPCDRIIAPTPMKSCTCTPKPSLREAFREALQKLCPKSRSHSKTAVVCLNHKKYTDQDSGTQTPPQEVCLKAKDYKPFDGCQRRSGDVAKIDTQPAEKPKDVCPKEKEVEMKTEEELPPCPYPCTPVDNYEKYDSTPIEKEPVEDNAQSSKEPETPAPPPPEKKPVKEHCKRTPPQSQFCGYKKEED